jgi:hypothetical protein
MRQGYILVYLILPWYLADIKVINKLPSLVT